MKRPSILLLAVSITMPAGAAVAQDEKAPAAAPSSEAPETEPTAPTAQDELEAALQALGASESLLFTGTIMTEESKLDEGASIGGLTRVVIRGAGGFGGGTGGEAFEGAFEAWRTAEGETVFVSQDALPGFAWFTDGEREVTQVTAADGEAPDPGAAIGELRQILDLERLRRAVQKAKLDGDATALRGEISKRFVEGDEAALDPLRPRVLRVDSTFELTTDGALRAMEFRVLRSDPIAAMERRALEHGAKSGGRVEMKMEIDPTSMQEDAQEEGATSIYRIEVSSGAPTPRTKEFVSDMRDLLAEEEV